MKIVTMKAVTTSIPATGSVSSLALEQQKLLVSQLLNKTFPRSQVGQYCFNDEMYLSTVHSDY